MKIMEKWQIKERFKPEIINFDEYQQEIITANVDNMMVIAGAGSGKTAVIIGRINYLLENKNVSPSSVTILSYTTKTVKELKERINNPQVKILTIHALAYSIISKIKKKTLKIVNQDFLIRIIEQYLNSNMPKTLKKQINHYFKHNETYLKDLLFKHLTLERKKDLKGKITKRNKLLMKIAADVLAKYQTEKRLKDAYDYRDLLTEATYYLKTKKVNSTIDYLLIDEYQDLSDLRYDFIKALQKQSSAKLMVVGDDAQSIYSFNGANLNIFYRFGQDFKPSQTYYLKNTYRFSQELINITSRFIEKNGVQLKKDLVSKKSLTTPVIIKYYESRNTKIRLLEKTILEINKNCKILILGRYHFDLNFLLSSPHFKYYPFNNKIVYTLIPAYDITYLTVHSAKGLGFDEVILINNENGVYGFPSKVTSDDLLRDDNLKKAKSKQLLEERRLFYVALTRTKNHVYLLVDKNHQSNFIKEIKKIIK